MRSPDRGVSPLLDYSIPVVGQHYRRSGVQKARGGALLRLPAPTWRWVPAAWTEDLARLLAALDEVRARPATFAGDRGGGDE